MKAIFMGSPQFAVPSLERLAGEGYDVEVVTQPDRPAGRGAQVTPPAVKVAAERLGLGVFQPRTLRDPEVVARLREAAPDVIVVVAYGELLRQEVLDLPARGCVNVHPSLLPRWRGPTPMPAAIAAGDELTGVSIILMDAGMDTGPLLAQEEVPVERRDTTASLGARLAALGADLLARTLPRYLAGEITPRPQPDEGATVSRLLRKEDGMLDWSRPALELERLVRAYDPWPGTFTYWRGRRLRILAADAYDTNLNTQSWEHNDPGSVISLSDNASSLILGVRTGAGWLSLERLQLEGRSPAVAAEFLAGYPSFVGADLGEQTA